MKKSLFLWRFFLFIMFILFAAPLEYHVEWLKVFFREPMTFRVAIDSPLSHGALIFYSVIVAIEAWFRLEMHPHQAMRPASYILKGFCFLVLPTFIVYLIRGFEEPLYGTWISFQWYLAVGSFIISLAVFFYLERIDKALEIPLSQEKS